VTATGRRGTNFRSQVSAVGYQVRVLQVRVRVREATTFWGLIPRGCPVWHCITGKGEWGMSSNYVPLKVLGLGKVLSEKVFIATNDRRFQREVTLKNQLRRAALSVPSNIAEGDARGYSQEGIRFFKIAIASAEEAKIQLSLALRIGIVPPDKANKAVGDLSSVCRMLNKLISSRNTRGTKLE
jgi:four helix bundle protein